ncbi:sucrose-specific PTS transporter subunit IIBC [Lactococcus muris]|uniref:protein-N(pi)-phosphohistidine--sucrose phosphotransferase n=1 Tax=Lactococcus muris TaxID=2941330 RepID=A0ABV4DCN8_9LACT
MNHKEVAERVLEAVGKDNLQAAAHCATRLRLVVKDSGTIDQEALDNDPDLKGTFETAGQYQIIVGPGDVNVVYDELVKMTGVSKVSTTDLKEIAANQKRQSPVMALVKLLSDIFVPLIPALVAGGLLMALNNVFTSAGLFGPKSLIEMYPAWKDVAGIINTMAAAPFTFLPILIGYSATKRFGGNAYLGAVMGMILVMPDLVNGYNVAEAVANNTMPYWNIFGLNIAQAGYQGQVLPVIAIAYILAKLEKFFHKHLNDAVDFTFTPLLSVIITGFLSFTIVGPVLRTVADALTNGLVSFYNIAGWLGMGIFGSFYSAIVITGLHQSFPAIETMLIANLQKTGQGGDFIFVVASAANMAQAGATFAIFFITKNKKTKALAAPSGVSALLGITEPALFGVNLKYKYPFFIALGASGIASLFMGLFHVLAASLGSAGILGFISIKAGSIPMFLVGILISFVLAFVVTYIYGKPIEAKKAAVEKQEKKDETVETVTVLKSESQEIAAPLNGEALPLNAVNDPVFSKEVMGKGIAVKPSEGQIFAPADGEIMIAYETGHAYGIKTTQGAEILLHIGIDTVSMAGKGFEQKVTAGQTVKKGDLLGSFDRKAIEDAGLDDTVMVIVTNTAEFSEVQPLKENTRVKVGEALLTLTK